MIEPDLELAARAFEQLRERTADAPGVTRASYGLGEQVAHELIHDIGLALGCEVKRDFAGNTYLTLPGLDRDAKRIIIGSHLDSVPHGGNYDGAAGVVAGVAALSGLRRAGIRPAQDVVVMGIRAEEGCWFPATWIGSRMALGTLAPQAVDTLRRTDTGRTLADHMIECGCDPDVVRRGTRHLDPASIACYLEPHIEQGPVLAAEGLSLGIVEAIMGGPRFRDAFIHGVEAHAGGAPRAFRHDAVAALGDFIAGVNRLWRQLEGEGRHTVFTFGIVATNPALHSFSRVPGEVRFCFDSRAVDESTKRDVGERLQSLVAAVERDHGVRFDLGADSGPAIAPMDVQLSDRLAAVAAEQGIAFRRMPSGAGHDAGAFIEAGVPSAMLFIRNEHGSHNPGESMTLDDFAQACRVLTGFLAGQG
ncbi:MAG: hydantoinase/carbamoylase family amidase [Casimicrobiaceae bacterium]